MAKGRSGGRPTATRPAPRTAPAPKPAPAPRTQPPATTAGTSQTPQHAPPPTTSQPAQVGSSGTGFLGTLVCKQFHNDKLSMQLTNFCFSLQLLQEVLPVMLLDELL